MGRNMKYPLLNCFAFVFIFRQCRLPLGDLLWLPSNHRRRGSAARVNLIELRRTMDSRRSSIFVSFRVSFKLDFNCARIFAAARSLCAHLPFVCLRARLHEN